MSAEKTIWHVGRHWPDAYQQGSLLRPNSPALGKTIEQECPCPVEPCGLIAEDKIDADCPQHGQGRTKTIRASHRAEDCPANEDRR